MRCWSGVERACRAAQHGLASVKLSIGDSPLKGMATNTWNGGRVHCDRCLNLAIAGVAGGSRGFSRGLLVCESVCCVCCACFAVVVVVACFVPLFFSSLLGGLLSPLSQRYLC